MGARRIILAPFFKYKIFLSGFYLYKGVYYLEKLGKPGIFREFSKNFFSPSRKLGIFMEFCRYLRKFLEFYFKILILFLFENIIFLIIQNVNNHLGISVAYISVHSRTLILMCLMNFYKKKLG